MFSEQLEAKRTNARPGERAPRTMMGRTPHQISSRHLDLAATATTALLLGMLSAGVITAPVASAAEGPVDAGIVVPKVDGLPADFINGVEKHVATSAPLDRDWAHSSAIDGDVVELVRELKDRPGGDIGVHASIALAQTLLAAGVVEELRLVIAPTIAGRGRRLLDGLPSIQLDLVQSVATPTGHLLVDYRVV